ncbi:MAG: hypothetical protein ACREDU_03445, partial [Methylocella sp.]
MSARKIKRLEAGRIERQLAPQEAEIKAWAKAGASPKPAASERVAQVDVADAVASWDRKAPARGLAEDSRTVAAAAPAPDFERLCYNLARLMEQGGRTLAAYFNPSVSNDAKSNVANGVADALRSISRIAEHWLSDPARTLEAQSSLTVKLLGLW